MSVDPEEIRQESVYKASLMAYQLAEPDLTFPSATADVAMSRTKLSLSLAGAATLMGLVPKVHYRQQVQNVRIGWKYYLWHKVAFVLKSNKQVYLFTTSRNH